MIKLLTSGGLLILTAAYTGRQPHGIINQSSRDSPFTNDFYENITIEDLTKYLNHFADFKEFDMDLNLESHDIYFWGIKK